MNNKTDFKPFLNRRTFLLGLGLIAAPGLVLANNHGHHQSGHMMQPTAETAMPHANHGGMHDHMGQVQHAGPHGGHTPGMSHGTQVGRAGLAAEVNRTVPIDMHDNMRFNPQKIEINAGDTVRFFIRNAGQQKHDFVIGTREELAQHAQMMQQDPNMAHGDPNMISLQPRQRGGVIWHFDKPGTYYFGCLLPGHYDAGMIGTIVVK